MRPGPPSLSVLLLMLSLMRPPTSATSPHESAPPASCQRGRFPLAALNPQCAAMRISEGPGPPAASRPACELATNNSQCLSSSNADPPSFVCSQPGRTRLEHCREFALADALADSDQCARELPRLRRIDADVGLLLCSFEQILRRYDCATQYSVAYHCAHCREAYRRWLCASVLAFHGDRGEGPIKPCRSVCYAVQQRCPFFLPGDTGYSKANQYAGEPSFVCLDPNIPETGEQMENSMYGESCCYEYCDAGAGSQNGSQSQFCIRNRTSCQDNKYRASSSRHTCGGGQAESGLIYVSPPAACTSGSTSPSPPLLSMFVLVISVPTIVNLSTAMLPMISSSLLILSMLKLQLKSILKSLLSCLLRSSSSCLLSWLRLLVVSCSTLVITCLYCLLRIATRLSGLKIVVLYPPLTVLDVIQSAPLYYCGILLNVSFNSIVRILHQFEHLCSLLESLPRIFYKLSFTLFALYLNYCLDFLTPLKFSMIRHRWIVRTDRKYLQEKTLLLDILSKIIKLKNSDLILTLTNVKSNLLLNNKHNLVLVLIKLFLIFINFLLEIAVIILLKLCYSFSFDCLNKIKLKRMYEKQFVINLLFTLINLSQQYCFLSSNFKYYYYDYYYLLFKLTISLLLLCRYNYQILLFTMNIFIIEYNYSSR